MLKSILPCLLFVCFLATANAAGELQLLMSSKVNVDDINDHQYQDCDTYLFQEELLFDNPNQLALFQNQAYRLGFEFTAFVNNKQLTARDIGESGIRVDVSPREKASYKIRAVSQSGGKVILDLTIFGEIEQTDTLRVQLWGNSSELIAEAIYPFQVYDASGDFSGMAMIPYMIQIEPAFVIISDAANANNFTQKEASMGGEPFLLKKGKEYNFEFELEKHVNIDGQEYVVIVDENNQYGYHIRYSWDQPLDFKKQNNGFSGTLITKTDSRTRPNIPLWVNGDMTSLMPDKGKRTVQYLKFYQNDPNQNKVYADLRNQNMRIINQRKQLATVANAQYISNFQESDIKNIEKITPKSANLKAELLKGASFVVVEPQKSILQMDKIKTRYFLENNGNVKPQLMVPMHRMQIVTPPQNQVTPDNKNTRYQRSKSKSKAKSNNSTTLTSPDVNKEAMQQVKPKIQQQQQYVIANDALRTNPGTNGIHTLYIEACTDTDYLNCRPFQIQIKLVD